MIARRAWCCWSPGVFALVRGFVHESPGDRRLGAGGAGRASGPCAACPRSTTLAHQLLDKDRLPTCAAGAGHLPGGADRRCRSSPMRWRATCSAARLGSTDRALGFAFGLVRGLVLCSLAFMVVSLAGYRSRPSGRRRQVPAADRARRRDRSSRCVPSELADIEAQTKGAAAPAEQLRAGQGRLRQAAIAAAASPRIQKNDDKGPNYDAKGMDRLIENHQLRRIGLKGSHPC